MINLYIEYLLLASILLFGIFVYFRKRFNTKDQAESNNSVGFISGKAEAIISASPLKLPKTQKGKANERIEKDPTPVPSNKIEFKSTTTETAIVVEDGEIESKTKYIGYEPNDLFNDIKLVYPRVLMPKPQSVIKDPQKGRTGRKGFKEKSFKEILRITFKDKITILDNQVLMVKNENSFEPDFSLIILENGINIFIDIEIDEPYEGINDIETRRITHYIGSNIDRDTAFTRRGWIVIRFSEIQIHQFPHSCCRFIADVISSIYNDFQIPRRVASTPILSKISQWDVDEGQQMSYDKYRESYLGIDSFGLVSETVGEIKLQDTELGTEIEEQIEEEKKSDKSKKSSSQEIISSAIFLKKTIQFIVDDKMFLVVPLKIENHFFEGNCYIKNNIQSFHLSNISSLQIKDSPFLLEALTINVGLETIKGIINDAIRKNQFVQIHYTRADFPNIVIDNDTGEIINLQDPEAPIRTISHIRLAIDNVNREPLGTWVPNENYITAHCHTRDAERMFRFDRIQKVAVLDF